MRGKPRPFVRTVNKKSKSGAIGKKSARSSLGRRRSSLFRTIQVCPKDLRPLCGRGGYGVNLEYCFRRAASYVHNILKGTSVADLPIEFPTKLELIINLKTAKALGLTVPDKLLAIADEVIE